MGKLSRIKRRLVVWKRRHIKPSGPTCPYPHCPYYLTDKWVARIQADEYGNKVTAQYVCDYFGEANPKGCGNSFVWLKEDRDIRRGNAEERSKPKDRSRYDSSMRGEGRHQSGWPQGWRKPEWDQ